MAASILDPTERKQRVSRIRFLRTLGRGLAGLRKERRLYQTELAQMLGVAPETVSRWENGFSEPSKEHRAGLDRIFGKLERKLKIDPKNWSNL